jgi:DNA-directed RNA polymerase subunit beta
VVSEEGQRAEMRDEDDDLLRAAEELGIDLSGVRALAGDGAAGAPGDGGEAAAPEAAADGEAAEEDDGLGVEELIDVDAADELDLDSIAASEEPVE